MKIHYYLDWFYEKGFSEKLTNVLREDITDRKSLVMISAKPPEYDEVEETIDNVFEKTWFNQADIIFGEYHLVNEHTQKEDAQLLIQNASVVFLCGGDTQHQKHLLTEYGLSDLIKISDTIVMGTSAGGMNMSNKFIDKYADAKRPDYKIDDELTMYEGMALNPFSFEAHFDHDNIALIEERFTLSEKMDIYVAANKDGAVRVKNGKIDIIGNVYFISHSKFQKLVETL